MKCIENIYLDTEDCFQLGACKVKFPNDALNQEQITNTQDEENSNNKKGNIEQSDLNLEQEIRTIPEDWSYKELETGTLYFMIENEEVGGLYINHIIQIIAIR
ncbi:MAG: hypothetical protein CVV00_12950 [Firmicutes bacterium HGW-Firmicutes-5]|nr:MAG: hypothetical protein CVV00_12950 [Firmicutes bacterium HGW-Firmicutes-5]